MRDWRGLLVLCVFVGLSGYYVVGLARQGEPVGWLIIAAVIVVFLLLVFLALVVVLLRAQRAWFGDNVRENLALMRQVQALQNAQMSGLARSLRLEREAQRVLPAPEAEPVGLVFAEGVFDGLEE